MFYTNGFIHEDDEIYSSAGQRGRNETVEIPVPQPAEGQVLIRVEASGVCNGDSMAIGGAALEYPRIPGHQVVGSLMSLEQIQQSGRLKNVSALDGMEDIAM
ncbi:alcohol dehydrogenase catalytic domain-containing protein [Paenibacillus ottowii]